MCKDVVGTVHTAEFTQTELLINNRVSKSELLRGYISVHSGNSEFLTSEYKQNAPLNFCRNDNKLNRQILYYLINIHEPGPFRLPQKEQYKFLNIKIFPIHLVHLVQHCPYMLMTPSLPPKRCCNDARLLMQVTFVQ